MAGVVFPNIEARREDLGVSKVRMAEKLGIALQTLDNKLNGVSGFTAAEIRTLSSWWGVSADELLKEEVPA